MRRNEGVAAVGWFALGSPLILLIVLASIAVLFSSSPATLLEHVRADGTQQAIGLSLRTTLVSSVLVALFGTCIAMAIHKARPAIAGALELLVTIPVIMPPSVAGLALLLAFGRQGLLGSWLDSLGVTVAFTPVAVVMAQVLVSAPFFVREASNAFQSLDPELVDAARLDGANSFMVGRWVIIPLAMPFLLTGVILAWARALGEFGATILFAGNLKGVTQTMPLAVYLGFESDLEQAKALAVILLLTAVLVLLIVRLAFGRRMSFAH